MGVVEGFKVIIVNEKGIRQKTFFKKIEIPKDQVKGYAEIYHPNTKGVQVELVIFSNTDHQVIKVYKEGWYEEYELLLKKIKPIYKKVGPKVTKALKEKRKKLYKNIGKGFGLCFFFFGLYQYLFPTLIILEEIPNPDGTYSAQFPLWTVLLMFIGIGIFLFYEYVSKGHD